MSDLLRKGRLSSVRKDVTRFTSSIKSDVKILKPVIKINQAHTIMMVEQKIVEATDGAVLLKALGNIKGEKMKTSLEDVHMYVEEEVTKAAGPIVGGNLHIAKSRNDQVSTAIRMELRGRLVRLMTFIMKVQKSMNKLAEKHVVTIVPGYTHLQPAQPVTFSHYLVSYVDVLERDLQRLEDIYPRVNHCPMGACALATTSFPINRERVSTLLGFDDVSENSIDAVGSRDFLLETMAALSILAVNISRIVEDLIVWSSLDFGLIELPDDFAFTSSIMPQKKNPDVLEVIRSRMAHVLGGFLSCAVALRTLPSGYSMDFQEVTPLLWESFETVEESLDMFSKLFSKLRVSDKALDKPIFNFITSTELANTLTRKYGVPFRTAHRVVGILCRYLVENGLTVSSITPELLEKIVRETSGLRLKAKLEDIRASVDPIKFVEAHSIIGGPSPKEVRRAIESRKQRIASSMKRLTEIRARLIEADRGLEDAIKIYSLSP